jgi:carbonic anhydrase
MSPAEVIQYLKDGNERFLAGNSVERNLLEQVKNTAEGQYPMAAILGCIDSRVPVEIVFDKGVGDVFTVRVAGNFVNTDILGSLEFATAVAGSKAIVVLGHSQCGAIKGACDHVEMGNLTSTLANLAPAMYRVDHKLYDPLSSANRDYVDAVTEANIRLTTRNIVNRSAVIRDLVAAGKLVIIGANHQVETGKVDFLDDTEINQSTL